MSTLKIKTDLKRRELKVTGHSDQWRDRVKLLLVPGDSTTVTVGARNVKGVKPIVYHITVEVEDIEVPL